MSIDTDIFSRGGITGQENDDQARRAVKAFRSLQPTLSAYARVLTKRREVRVEMAARDNGSTDGTRINFRPPMALGDPTPHQRRLCDKRDERHQPRCPACLIREDVLVTIYHEIAHICFDSFAETSESDRAAMIEAAIKEVDSKYAENVRRRIAATPPYVKHSYIGLANLINPFLPIIVNALEDARVNRELFKARKGTKIMFDAETWRIFTEGVEQKDPSGNVVKVMWNEYPLNMQVIVGIFCKASGYDYSDWFAPKVVEALDDEELTQIVRGIDTVRSAASVYHLSFPVLARLRELGFCKAETDPDPDPEPESEENGEQSDEPGDESESSDESGGKEGSSEEGEGGSSESSESDTDQEDQAGGDGDSGREQETEGDSDSAASDTDESMADDESGDTSHDAEDSAEGTDPAKSEESADDSASEGDPGPEGDEVNGSDDSEATPSSDDGESGDTGDTDDDSDSVDPNTDPGESEESSSQDGDHEGSSSSTEGDDANRSENASSSGSLSSDRDSSAEREEAPSGLDEKSDDGDESRNSPRGEETSSRTEESSTEGDPIEEPIDTGADDGQGGTSIIEEEVNDDLPMGTPDECKTGLLKWGDHEEKPKTVAERREEKAIDKAIIQGLYFETPSRNIHGVREHKYGQPILSGRYNMSQAWDSSYYTSAGISRSALGADGDFDVPESILGPALLRMRVAFSDNQRGKELRHRKSGRVDGRVLGKRANLNDERLFKKRVLPGKKDYFVLIGMDISGSTIGKNISLEKKAVLAQAELLDRMGINFAIYAHSGNYHDPAMGRGVGLDLDMYLVKEPHEVWDHKTQERLTQIGPDAANLDGHSLEYYRKILDKVNATDKIILYYTDGKMPAENHDEELEILQREIKVCKQKSYTLLGVGIRTDSPVRHGLDTVQVDEDADVVKVVRHLERRLLAT